jgi:hypothetical protein
VAPRGKLDIYNLIERALRMYSDEKMTLEQIARVFKAEGYDVSREAVRTGIISGRQAAERLNQANAEARAILQAARDSPNLDIVEAGNALLANHMLNAIKNIEHLEFEKAPELVRAMSDLARAQVQVGKARLGFQNGVAAAKKEIMRALQDELAANHVDLLSRLGAIVEAIEVAER